MVYSVDQKSLSDAGAGESSVARIARSADGPARAPWIWGICGFLLLAVGLVFGQTARHRFISVDDDGFVVHNPHVTPGLTLPGLWWALTDGPYGEWTPVTTLSHMLDCQLFGLDPAGHHLTNVLLHAVSSVLLFLVLLRMTGDLWPSAWVAAIFAIHPLHVSTVAWVAERREVLSGLFFMLTLGAYTRYVERPSLARYLPVCGCLALGLMAKAILVTVPFVLLLLDYWPLDRWRQAARSASWPGRLPVGWRLVVEKIPLLAVSATSCAIVMSTHASFRLIEADPLSLATRLANALVSYAAYVGQSFYPVNLSPFYHHRGVHLPIAWAAESLLLLVAITAVAAYCWRRLPYLLVGWLWFLGMLVPVLGLVGNFLQSRADNYTYLSQIGLSIAVAWGVWNVYRSRQSRQPARWRQWTLAVMSGAAILGLATVAWRQTSYWRDDETVFTRAVSCAEQNSLAHSCLAHVYAAQGRTTEAIDQLHEALATYSIARRPTAESHVLLAKYLAEQGKTDEALAHLKQAVSISPTFDLAHACLAIALAREGQLDQAIAEFRETIRLAPALLQPRIDLANVLLAHGEAGEAIAQCREVLEKDPNAVQAMIVLGAALTADGQDEEAITHLERAVTLEPHSGPAQFSLGLALHERGHSNRALVHLNEAVRLQPDNVRTLWQTAWILATDPDSAIRDGARAVEFATQAVQLSGGRDVHAFDALSAALAETKKFSAAVDAAERASALALARGDDALMGAIEQRTRQYREGLPYRQPAATAPR